MRRALLVSCFLPLLLAGCPSGEQQSSPPRPTSQPVAEIPPAPGDTAPPASQAPATPAPPDVMKELAALSPRMTFDLKPGLAVMTSNVTVVLERLAMLRRDEAHLAKEPWDAKSEVSDQGHYLALTLAVTVDGKPWSELPPGEQVGCIGPVVIQWQGEPVLIESTNFEPLPGRPETAYQYRRFVPPEHKDGELILTIALQLEGQEPISFEFPPLRPLRPQKPGGEEKPAEPAPGGEEKPTPPEQPKPPEEPKQETGEEEH